jgi:hypothetical protein
MKVLEDAKPNLTGSLSLQNCGDDDKVLAMAEGDIAHLCGQNILLWQQFLEMVVNCEPVRSVLARHHHQQRVRFFSSLSGSQLISVLEV